MNIADNVLFTVKSPLCIRNRTTGDKTVIAELFPHPDGLIIFETFWHLSANVNDKIHWVKGHIEGNGPWKVGDSVITIAACHGSDPEIALAVSEWQTYLQTNQDSYPSTAKISCIAKQFSDSI